jgi:histidinol phosphatase-like PHP family hydrolase
MDDVVVRNADIAELLAHEAEHAEGVKVKAFKRASRRAFTWPVEAATIEDLTELESVGPFLARVIGEWIAEGRTPDEPPPPLRRDFLTFAEAKRVAAKAPRVRGDLQMHSTWSDGGSSIAEMADAAKERGYEYIAMTDHSHGLRIVKGLDEAALERQACEIAKVEGIRVLRSIEMNLSPAGEGDLEPSALTKLDIVLGSFHSQLRKKEDQTERYLAAIADPYVHVLAHPRGRIYNYRLGLSADWPRVFAAAAAADKALEIDSYPDRQDLNVELLTLARKEGVRISIGTDAHWHPQLEWIDLGIAAARKAEIAPDRILNLMPLSSLLEWTASVRERAA